MELKIVCPLCNKETSSTAPYCVKCGKKIEITSDEIKDSLSTTIEAERDSYSRMYTRAFLVFSIFIFIVSMIFFISTNNQPRIDIEPEYPFASPPADAIEGGDEFDKTLTPIDLIPLDSTDFPLDIPDASNPKSKGK